MRASFSSDNGMSAPSIVREVQLLHQAMTHVVAYE